MPKALNRKADYDLGLSLLHKDEMAHAPVMERLQSTAATNESRATHSLQVARQVGIGLVARIRGRSWPAAH